MKKLKLSAFVILVAAALWLVPGCTTKIQVIDDGSSKTNQVHKVESGFNDETYVWESWTFSTNRVVK